MKLKKVLGNTVAFIYFVFPMCSVLLMLVFIPILFIPNVNTVRSSGFAGPNTPVSFIGVCGLFIGLSLVIPPLRKMYRVLPWLFAFIKIFFANFVILCVGEAILNLGYQVNNNARHTTFFIIMIVQVIVCRIAMCIYFKQRPVRFIEER